MICCFIGHSDAPESIYPSIASAIERHITEYGVSEFRVGNYGAFDRMSARAAAASRARHPGIKLFLMLPYLPDQGHPLPPMDGFDGSIYPEGMETVPYRLAIPRLNRIMVEQAGYAIAYVAHSWGGAAKTLEYARMRERKGLLQIENLGDWS